MSHAAPLAPAHRPRDAHWPHNHLQRFVEAQDPVWYAVVEELAAGRKASHWMWFIFPQLRGLGESRTSNYYGLGGRAEAVDYWVDDVLGDRLKMCVSLLLALPDGSRAEDVLGAVDARKLRSSMTLFERVAGGGGAVTAVLNRYFKGERCGRTLQMLADN